MTLFAGALIIIVSTLAAAIVLRNLGWIVEKFLGAGVDGKLDFVRIFGQTQHAQLSVHWLLPMLFGLCNDKLGYILPPSAYLLNDDLPYIETVTDAAGENHYEETNSVGIQTAEMIAKAFEDALKEMQ